MSENPFPDTNHFLETFWRFKGEKSDFECFFVGITHPYIEGHSSVLEGSNGYQR